MVSQYSWHKRHKSIAAVISAMFDCHTIVLIAVSIAFHSNTKDSGTPAFQI